MPTTEPATAEPTDRAAAWRHHCPTITDAEVAALEALPEAHGQHSPAARMLAAYRAGQRDALRWVQGRGRRRRRG